MSAKWHLPGKQLRFPQFQQGRHRGPRNGIITRVPFLINRANTRDLRSPPPPPYYLPLNITLYVFLISNAIAAFLAPIQDCDEVFNFWEPTHYLDHGYGLQTWEYSPVYSIRSWLYVTIHAIVGKAASLTLVTKSSQFYAVRLFLALICAACQTRLYAAICRTLSPKIGLFFLMIIAFSPGMFHASASFLPSSFTMYMSMLGLTAFLDWRRQKIAQGIMWFGLGAIVGWPFAGALIVPLLLTEVLVGFISGSLGTVVSGIFDGAIRCLAILVCNYGLTVYDFRLVLMRCRLRKLLWTTLSSESLLLCLGISSPTTSLAERAKVQISSV